MAALRDELKAAIIIGGSLLVLSALIILIGGAKLFTRYDTYYTRVTNAAGLEVGAQVRLGGVRAGRVLDILAPAKGGELVTIVIGVNEGTPIYNGTTARISQIGFVGDIYLLLSVRGTTAGRLSPGATLPAVEPVEFTEIMEGLNRVSASLEVLIADIDRVFSEKNLEGIESLVANTNAAISNASADFDRLSGGLYETTAKMKEVLSEVEALLRDGRGDFGEVMEKAKRDLDAAEAMLRAAEDSARKLGEASDSVGRALGGQEKNIDEVLTNMNRTLRDMQDLLETLKLKPWSVIYREAGEER